MSATGNIWSPASGDERLEGTHVHVWRADLPTESARVEDLQGVLSADENARAERYPLVENRRRFVAARAVLRHVLARYADCPPDQLRFAYGEHGKPQLVGDGASSRLEFNMSHSGDVVLYAVASGRAVGVDVEHLRTRDNYMRIAQRFFSIEEYEALAALPAAERPRAFYRCWTRKEAYVKARGDGIAAGLDTFSVSLDERAAILRSDEGAGETARWNMSSLQLGEGYIGALCAEGADGGMAQFTWPHG